MGLGRDPPAVPSSTFFAEELGRALAECGFGILSWEVKPSNGATGCAAEARADVELLPDSDEAESGRKVQISLSIKGYQLQRPTETSASLPGKQHFETLDDLLCASSPAFEKRRTKLLFEKLEDIAASRSWNDYDEEVEEAGESHLAASDKD